MTALDSISNVKILNEKQNYTASLLGYNTL